MKPLNAQSVGAAALSARIPVIQVFATVIARTVGRSVGALLAGCARGKRVFEVKQVFLSCLHASGLTWSNEQHAPQSRV